MKEHQIKKVNMFDDILKSHRFLSFFWKQSWLENCEMTLVFIISVEVADSGQQRAV